MSFSPRSAPAAVCRDRPQVHRHTTRVEPEADWGWGSCRVSSRAVGVFASVFLSPLLPSARLAGLPSVFECPEIRWPVDESPSAPPSALALVLPVAGIDRPVPPPPPTLHFLAFLLLYSPVSLPPKMRLEGTTWVSSSDISRFPRLAWRDV